MSKEKSRAAFDRQAGTYDQSRDGQHARSLYPAMLNRIADVSYHTALDLGCGTGEMMRLILERDGEKCLTGLDLSEKMLEVSGNKLGDRVTLCLGDSERLPFAGGSFDLVYCCDSFHHYPAPERVLEEVSRVLKSGGTLVLGDFWQPLPMRALMNRLIRFSREGDVKIYSEREIRAMLAQRFREIHWERAGRTAYVAWGIKE